MPLLENSATDDQILLDGDTGFTGGQASNVRRNLIKEGAYTAGKNIDYDVFGNLVTRRGAAVTVADALDGTWDGTSALWSSTLVWGASDLEGAIISLECLDNTSTEMMVLAEYGVYSTGTASQALDVITGVDTAWTSEMVGRPFTFADDTDGGTITGFTDATHLTVDTSQTVASQGYSIYLRKIKFVEAGSAISVLSPDTSFSGTDVYFAQLSDRMYWCDGVGALQYISTSGGASSVTAGVLTSVRGTEMGKGYTTAPVVTFSSDSGTPPSPITAQLGYGGRVVKINFTGGTSISDDASISIADAPTGGTNATAVPQISQLPSKPKLLTSHTNRLFCCSADTAFLPDQVFVSGILDGESWDVAGDQIRVTKGDGDPIVALCPWYDFKLVVLKERSIWVVDANPSQNVSDWTISLLSDRVGCVSHKSVQQVGADVYFLSREGIQSVSNIEAGSQAAVQVAISAPIDDFINRINQDQWGKCASAYYGNRYMISLPLDDSTIPNVTLVYNTLHKGWSGYWTGWEPRAFAVTAFGGKIRLNFGDEEGRLYTWRDYINEQDATTTDYMDNLNSYESEVISRGYNFKELYSDKLGYQVEFDLENFYYNESQDVKFYYLKNMSDDILGLATEGDSVLDAEDDASLDGWSSRELLGTETISNRESHFIKGYNLLSKNKFKEIQFVAHTASGRLALQAVKTSAFPDTIDPQR